MGASRAKRAGALALGAWLALGTWLALGASHAQAQEAAFPTKPIRIIVPFPAGSGTDQSARLVAGEMSRLLGQSVVIDNKAGGNGLIAAQEAKRAAPDGHTLFVTTMTTHAVNVHLYKSLPYDPVKDFAPISLMARSPLVLVVRNTDESPRTLAELTERAKKAPGKLTFASGSTSTRAGGELYQALAGIDLVHVPYKGTPQALGDLVGGQVDLMFPDLSPAVPLIQQGRLRPLGVTAPKRASSLPQVPTLGELGLPGFELLAWSAAFAPAGTPRPVIDKLNGAIRAALNTKEATEFFARTGSELAPSTPEELGAYVRTEIVKWGEIVKRAGIQPE